MYTPPVTPWESVTPEVSDPTVRRELPKVGPITGVKGGVYKTRERIHRDMLIRDY